MNTPNVTARFIGATHGTHQGHAHATRDRRGRVILNGPHLRLRMTKDDAYALANMLVDAAEKPNKPRKWKAQKLLEGPPS